jgi:Fe-S cluster assembly protein SufD
MLFNIQFSLGGNLSLKCLTPIAVFSMTPMNEAAALPGFQHDSFEAFIETRDEPGWLVDHRRDAWDTFCEFAWPDRRNEEWLRTDIRLFNIDRFSMPYLHESAIELPAGQLSEGVSLGGFTKSLNSHTVDSHVAEKLVEKGVIFGSLAALTTEHGDLVRPHLMTRAFNPRYDKFAALHAACWCGGTLLYVPRNTVIAEPFHALSAIAENGVDFGHTLVILEEGAEATMLAETTSLDASHSGFHCGGIELILKPGARLRYVNLQDWNQQVWHFAHQKAIVDRDASLQWTVGALGARLAKVNQHVELVGEGANCQVNGTMFTEGKQHLSYHTLQHHAAPYCQSDFLYKAALQDKSRTVWRGMIKVEHEAQRTDGYQRNDNLLLSHDARADSIPGLEIEADDVRCTHGSTTGKVDEELIFYAQCRGFTRKEAIRAIVTGFFQQIFDRIAIVSVRDALGQAIARRVREYE